jgi:HPt (histidine-containing phosphotransfer) domain-containing protein
MQGTPPDSDVQLDPGAVRALVAMVGGDREVVAEFVDEFLAEAPQRLAEMRSPDPVLAGRAAHTLKSNALTFGATELAEICRQIELAARDDEIPQETVARAGEAWARVRPELAGLR